MLAARVADGYGIVKSRFWPRPEIVITNPSLLGDLPAHYGNSLRIPLSSA